MSRSSWQCVWLLAGTCAAAFFAPAGRAEDAVESLKRALKEKNPPWAQVAKLTQKLHSLSEMRRGYFLVEWQADKLEAMKLRDAVGDRLAERVQASAAGDAEHQVAACILIGELGETDQPNYRPPGKYAARFTGLLIGTKKAAGLVHSDNIGVRQAALYALGKITPPPAEAMPALKSALKSDQLGPRRLAAYALVDLVKNSAYLPPDAEIDTINQAVAEAVRVLDQPRQDESIRGYCLQTVQTSARIFTDYRWAPKTPVQFELDKDKKLDRMVLAPNLQELLRSYRTGMPRFVSAMEKDPSIPVRLTALDTISQIISARIKICDELRVKELSNQEFKAKQPGFKGNEIDVGDLTREQLLKRFAVPDPIEPLLAGQWAVIPELVQQTKNERLKRGMMVILERIAEDVQLYVQAKKEDKQTSEALVRRFVRAVSPSLSDPDLFVRWSAARTLRYVPPEFVPDDAVEALGRMLIDPEQRDPDLSAAAADTIEAIASARSPPRRWFSCARPLPTRPWTRTTGSRQ